MSTLFAAGALARLKRVLGFAGVLAVVGAIGSLGVIPAHPQIRNETPPPGYPPSGCDYDQRGNYYCWGGNSTSSPAPEAPTKFDAIAVSDSTLRSGSSHGQNSQAAAEQQALANCSTVASDCKVQMWGMNRCVTLATSLSDGIWGTGDDANRDQAQSTAMALCRKSGKNCVLQTSVCASDSATFAVPALGANPVASSDPIVGCYRWFNGVPVVIRRDHKLMGGPFAATWQLVDAQKRAYVFTWPQRVMTKVTISADQRTLTGGNQYGGQDRATRAKGTIGLVGTWNWFDVVVSTVTINTDGTFSAVASGVSWHGTWQPINIYAGTYVLTSSEFPTDRVTLASNNSSVSGADQFGLAISGTKLTACSVN